MGAFATATFAILGCGGGSGEFTTVEELIENKDFYRVISAEDRYYKEVFDGNGSLLRDIYFMNDDFDYNSTGTYEITGMISVHITENNVTEECTVEGNESAVKFFCSEGGSGLVEETIRWFSLDDAKANPE